MWSETVLFPYKDGKTRETETEEETTDEETTLTKKASTRRIKKKNLRLKLKTSFIDLNRDVNRLVKRPGYYICGGQGTDLVDAFLTNLGWERIRDKNREDYKLRWTELKFPAAYSNFREGEQLIYQIPNDKVLTTKIGLLQSLQEYDRVMNRIQSNRRVMRYRDFFPESYRLDVREDRDNFFHAYKDGEIWISKPTGLNQGRGIYLIRDQAEVDRIRSTFEVVVKEDENEKEDTSKKRPKPPVRPPMARLVQRYVTNPLLLDGKKFDVRNYMIIACTNPLVVFYRDGYCRLTCTDYDTHSKDLTGHLTNQFMQKRLKIYEDMKEETVWSMDRFNDYINENFHEENNRLPLNWVHTVLRRRCQQVMLHCFQAVRHKLECKLGYFDLIGCDFLVHDDFSISILEMNNNPALHTNCEALREVIPDVVNETLGLTLECFEKASKNVRLLPFKTKHECLLLYNGDYYEEIERRERMLQQSIENPPRRNSWNKIKKNYNTNDFIYRKGQNPSSSQQLGSEKSSQSSISNNKRTTSTRLSSSTRLASMSTADSVGSRKPSLEKQKPKKQDSLQKKPFYAGGGKPLDRPLSSVSSTTLHNPKYKHIVSVIKQNITSPNKFYSNPTIVQTTKHQNDKLEDVIDSTLSHNNVEGEINDDDNELSDDGDSNDESERRDGLDFLQQHVTTANNDNTTMVSFDDDTISTLERSARYSHGHDPKRRYSLTDKRRSYDVNRLRFKNVKPVASLSVKGVNSAQADFDNLNERRTNLKYRHLPPENYIESFSYTSINDNKIKTKASGGGSNSIHDPQLQVLMTSTQAANSNTILNNNKFNSKWKLQQSTDT